MCSIYRSSVLTIALMLAALTLGGIVAFPSPASSPGAQVKQPQHNASLPHVVSDETYEAILTFYGYDKGMPLDARVVEREKLADSIREKVVFNSIRDCRVPGYLGLPTSGEGPYPIVLLIDGIMGSKSRWWEEDSWSGGAALTQTLLSAGFAVLALDAQYHGERSAANDYENPGLMVFQHHWYNREREMFLQTTVDYRRAIDYLETRPDIDSKRIGALGLSMGGIITFGLNASEPRLKASVAGVTPLNFWDTKEVAAISPFNFARGVGKRPFLMLMGRNDNWYSESEAESLFALIEGDPKELQFYDSGHRLPEEYIARAHEWFERYLK